MPDITHILSHGSFSEYLNLAYIPMKYHLVRNDSFSVIESIIMNTAIRQFVRYITHKGNNINTVIRQCLGYITPKMYLFYFLAFSST